MSLSALRRVEEYNRILQGWCNWEVELNVAEHDQSESYAVYRLEADNSRVFMGCIPTETPVGSLMCCSALCQHYYELGKSDPQSMRLRNTPD